MVISTVIDQLASIPRPDGCKKLKGSFYWRVRVGDYRIVDGINDEIRIVDIRRIGHRRDVYETY